MSRTPRCSWGLGQDDWFTRASAAWFNPGPAPTRGKARRRGGGWEEFGSVTPIQAQMSERKRPADGRCRGPGPIRRDSHAASRRTDGLFCLYSDEAALRSFLEARLIKYKVPKIISFRATPIPKSAVGKPLRRKVREEHLAELETARAKQR